MPAIKALEGIEFVILLLFSVLLVWDHTLHINSHVASVDQDIVVQPLNSQLRVAEESSLAHFIGLVHISVGNISLLEVSSEHRSNTILGHWVIRVSLPGKVHASNKLLDLHSRQVSVVHRGTHALYVLISHVTIHHTPDGATQHHVNVGCLPMLDVVVLGVVVHVVHGPRSSVQSLCLLVVILRAEEGV